jgi:HPt (histidine-containing phosphotransfer) domain-containing protein
MAILDSRFAGPLGRLDGDQKLFGELAAYFIEDAPQLLAAARSGMADRNAQAVARAVHGFGGLTATFDAYEAVGITKSIGQMVSNGDWKAVGDALAELETEVDNLRCDLGEYRKIGMNELSSGWSYNRSGSA